jgi:hypothetical protein
VITFLHPIWLILIIPLLVVWWVWKPDTPFLQYTRLAIILFILLALSGLAVNFPGRTGTVVVVADRSLSMPAGSEAAQKEVIELIQRAMGGDDRLAVVSFGENAVIERSPQSGTFSGFTNRVEQEASNLNEGIEKALALIPQDSQGKILVVSDGRWTGTDPSSAAVRAASRGVAVDYRLMQRSTSNDLALAQIDSPVSVTPGEAFMITAWVKSSIQQEINFELRRGGQILAAGRTNVISGLNRLTFRDTAGEPGVQSYTLKIMGNGEDPVPENNNAKVLIGVQGPRPLLVVSSRPDSGLTRLLSAGGMMIRTELPGQSDWSLDYLAQFSGVLIENVSAEKIGEQGMQTIASWVTETGAGMMMTGGKNAYGPGGYFKSPLEPIMPISMELRQEHRKLSLAIAIAMDRSGSMAVQVGGGRTKMDLANLAAVQVLDMLSQNDEFGAIAVDSASHIIADLNTVEANAKLRNKILQIDSGGGGIFIYEALTAAAEMLIKAKAGTRHIILLADASDSEEPGKYQELLRQCEEAGITVSVIGLGKPTDTDAVLLRDIAQRGNGQIFFTENAAELPRLFAQDTIVVARSTFLEEPTSIRFTPGLVALTGRQFDLAPRIGGYNLTYLHPQANLAVITEDEYRAPVTAAWQAGSGRVLCYTGEADGEYTGDLAGWKDAGEFFMSLARWTAGDTNNLPGNILITQEVRNGINSIQLHLDPERNGQSAISVPLQEMPKVTTLRGAAGSKPTSEKSEMRWSSADLLEVAIPLRGNETALSTVEISGLGRLTLAPVALPYSPEFKPVDNIEGQRALARLAQATGGRERIELSGIWKDLPRQPRLISLSPWLLIVATVLLLLEVFERQTGMIRSRLLPALQKVGVFKVSTGREKLKRRQPKTAPAASSAAETEQPPSPQTPEPEPAAILGALQQARKQAKERTDR